MTVVVFIYSITVHSCYNQTLHIFVWIKKEFYINISINGRKWITDRLSILYKNISNALQIFNSVSFPANILHIFFSIIGKHILAYQTAFCKFLIVISIEILYTMDVKVAL